MQRIVVKIGSKVLTNSDGSLNLDLMRSLAQDIRKLREETGVQFAMVSSGAVRTGRSTVNLDDFKIEDKDIDYDKAILREQILASIGQPRVMKAWIEIFEEQGIVSSEILTQRSVFADRKDYLSIRLVSTNLMRLGVIPIFNENDVLSPEELDFTDNDQQACMIAAMLVVDKLILMTDVGGVYSGSPQDKNSELIPLITDPMAFLSKVDKKSGSGKGGMGSKLMTADLSTNLGIDTHIVDGFSPNVIRRIMDGEKIGTFFPAKSEHKPKALKTWLASAAASSGKIVVSTYLAEILRKKQSASVLFSGIEQVEGDFEEGDVIEVCDDNGASLGRGIVKHGSMTLRQEIALYKKKTGKDKAETRTSSSIAIHYDYFYYGR